MNKAWQRIIVHVDFDAFFAAIEQRDNPELKNKAIGIVNGEAGTTLITSSYAARYYGIKTGMHRQEAERRCPDFQVIASRPHHYAEISSSIMQALTTITPDIEIFSVDEAFLDLTRCKSLYHHPKAVAHKIQALMIETVNLPCSIGISGDKSTAKIASTRNKPNGICIIPPWQANAVLKDMPVTKLCGINQGIGRFLAARGVTRCGQMAQLPISVLGSKYGNIGKRLWQMAQGLDTEPVLVDKADPKSMGCSKVIPPNTIDESVVKGYLYGLCDKLAYRLRQAKLLAKTITVGIKLQYGWLQDKFTLPVATCDDSQLFSLAKSLLTAWQGQGAYQVQITATEVIDRHHAQTDLFDTQNDERTRILALRDTINQQFGQGMLTTGSGLMAPVTSDVISPSWQPSGCRHSVATKTEREGCGKRVPAVAITVNEGIDLAKRQWLKIKGKSIAHRQRKLLQFLCRKQLTLRDAQSIAHAFAASGMDADKEYQLRAEA